MKRPHHGDISRFNEWASTYDHPLGQFFFDRIHRPVVEALLANGGDPSCVVDVGCGTGRLLEKIQPRLPGAELIGVDPAEGMLAVARRRFQGRARVRFKLGTADRLPLDDAIAEVVTTTLSFHHWGEQEAALREVVRVLRPGGRLILADILGIGIVGRILRGAERGHGSGYRDTAEMTRLLRGAGFSSWRSRRLFGPLVPVFLVEGSRRAAH